jgi:hypothetical protein
MNSDLFKIEKILKLTFKSASNIYIDAETQECEVTLSVDDYHGELDGYLVGDGVSLKMVDYCDVYPYKYVFSFKATDNMQYI